MTQILLVDDSSVIRKVARRICEGMNMQATEAENGHAALRVCHEALPDAILLDWNMPVMDGFDFPPGSAQLPGGHRPKIVFCTTENDPTHVARALHSGANGYLMKPFDREIIRQKFEEVGIL